MFNEALYIFLGTITLLFLEYKFSFRKYVFFSIQKKEDSLWYLVQQFLYPFLSSFFIFNIGSTISTHLPIFDQILDFRQNHILLQVIIFALLFDFLSYWIHRGFHTFPPLWKLHRVHHSTTELTVLSSFRTNFLDFLIHGLIVGFFTGLIHVNEQVRLNINLFFSFVCIVQHTNIRFRYPQFIENIVITPKNHLWHHSTEMHTKYGQNFGFLLVLWDKVFGTLFNPDRMNTTLGLSDQFHYSSILSRFIYPLDKVFKFFFNRS